jgi:hypothetical protein
MEQKDVTTTTTTTTSVTASREMPTKTLNKKDGNEVT